jgi:ABC-type transport system involved in multi-copper enzyme maturation permease subunit
MNAIKRKEIRQSLPMLVVAVALAWAPLVLQVFWPSEWSSDFPNGWVILSTIGCALILGMVSFGSEVGGGTLSLLLSQPIERLDIWRIKSRLVGVAFAFSALGMMVAFYVAAPLPHLSDEDGIQSALKVVCMRLLPVWILMAVGVTGGLWTSLFFKNNMVAICMTFIAPMAFIAAVMLGSLFLGLDEKTSDRGIPVVIFALLSLYSVASYWLARRLFLRMQDTVWEGNTRSITFNVSWLFAPLRCLGKGAVGSYVAKEIKLHQVMFLLALIIVVIRLVGAVVEHAHLFGNNSNIYSMTDALFVALGIIPALIGAGAIAEERRLNTLESSLCLPMGRKMQYCLKLGVGLGLSLLLGCVLPVLMEWGCGVLKGGNLENMAWGMGFASVGLWLVFTFASSLTRGVLGAIAVGTGAAVVLGTSIGILGHYSNDVLAMAASVLLMVPVLFGLSWNNYSHPRIYRSRVWGNCLVFCLGEVLVFGLVSGVHWRAWELVGTWEPKHGPSVLAGSVEPRIIMTYTGSAIILLPDGRLWASTKLQDVDASRGTLIAGTEPDSNRPIMPMSGVFLDSNNWTHVVYEPSRNGVLARRSDGSLWSLAWDAPKRIQDTNAATEKGHRLGRGRREVYEVSLHVQRFGNTSDWKSLVADQGQLIAIKNNGTLWMWERTKSRLQGASNPSVLEPEQIGHDSDWLNIYPGRGRLFGTKTNGTVWLFKEEGGSAFGDFKGDLTLSQLIQCPLEGTNWTAFASFYRCFIAVNNYGTMWRVGNYEDFTAVPATRKGDFFPQDAGQTIDFEGKRTWITRHETQEHWNQVSLPSAGITVDGKLFLNLANEFRGPKDYLLKEASCYRDWLALGSDGPGHVSLAADGTLCKWGGFDAQAQNRTCIPSRVPDWSLNILKDTQTVSLEP